MSDNTLRRLRLLLIVIGLVVVSIVHVVRPGWPHSMAMLPLSERLITAILLLPVQGFLLASVLRRGLPARIGALLGFGLYIFIEGALWGWTRNPSASVLDATWFGCFDVLFALPTIGAFTLLLLTNYFVAPRSTQVA